MNNLINDVYSIYNNVKIPKDAIKEIAILLSNNINLIYQFYHELKELPHREYKINYDLVNKNAVDALMKILQEEKNNISRAMNLILILRTIYDELLGAKENCFMTLDGETEIRILKKKVNYFVHVNVEEIDDLIYQGYFVIFGLESLFNKHLYVGIDFEYRNTPREIALTQLCFEHSPSDNSHIFIISPIIMKKGIMDYFIKIIMVNIHVKKILHGSDSQDIPYIQEKLLEGDPDKIIKFTKSMIDTRFLCEYYKVCHGEKVNQKCSLYDALIYFGVVSLEKMQELLEIEERMGPKQDIKWDKPAKLASYQVLYALYDSLFLKYYYYRVIQLAKKNFDKTNNDNETKTTAHKEYVAYKNLLYELTQFVYLLKRGIVMISDKMKQEVDPANNYMIKRTGGSGTITLINVYNTVGPKLIIDHPNCNLDNLAEVKYFRTFIQLLSKKITYSILSKKYKIFKDKTTIWDVVLDNDYVWQVMDELKFPLLSIFVKNLINVISQRISAMKI
jgi:hypothetical protein